MDAKRCPGCGVVLSAAEFYADRHRVDGLSHKCRGCTRAYMREYMRRRHGSVRGLCRECGVEVWGRGRLYCSERCRRERLNRKRRLWDGVVIECRMCRTRFKKSRVNNKYCSKACGSRAEGLRKKYGLSPVEYREMCERAAGRCEMCAQPIASASGFVRHQGKFHVDHCHETGRVRGLLCGGCNAQLGHFESVRTKAERYLAASELDLRELCLR